MTQNNHGTPNDIPTLAVEERPEAGALRRIIKARAHGGQPNPKDLAIIEKHRPLHDAQPEIKISPLIDELTGTDPIRQQHAWQTVQKLLQPPTHPKRVRNWNFPVTKRKWLIPHWLPAGRIGMLTGEGEKGKSLLAVQLAVSICTGGGTWEDRDTKTLKWTGPGIQIPFPAVEAGKVIIAGWEDEAEEVRRRLDWIESHERNAGATTSLASRLGEHFTYIDMAQHGPVWGTQGPSQQPATGLTHNGQWLRTQCEQHDAYLLILDPLINAFGADENSNKDAAQFMADWGGWAQETGCAVLILHHPSKGDKNSEDHGYRGASAWSAESRFHWQLTDRKEEHDEQHQDILIARKTSYAQRPSPIELQKGRTTAWTWAKADRTSASPNSAQGSHHEPFL